VGSFWGDANVQTFYVIFGCGMSLLLISSMTSVNGVMKLFAGVLTARMSVTLGNTVEARVVLL
jgi:hypothetical protein